MKIVSALLLAVLVVAMPVLACCCPDVGNEHIAVTLDHGVDAHHHDKHSDCQKTELQATKLVLTLLPDLKLKHSFDSLISNNGFSQLVLSGSITQNDPPDWRLPVIASTPIFLSTKRLRI